MWRRVRRVAKVLSILLAAGAVGLAAFAAWLVHDANRRRNARVEITPPEIPVPWPLTDQEVAALGETADDPPDVDAIALARAIERGQHIVETRAFCTDCHGDDLSGKVLVDSFFVGTFAAPNITSGGVTADYEVADWVRIIRHGVKHDGRTSIMPAVDFEQWADRDLSDIIAYVRTFPPVDAVQPAPRVGPLMGFLVWRDLVQFSAEHIDHTATRPRLPPEPAPTAEYGAYLVRICTGCHGKGLAGGPMPVAPPGAPVPPNLTMDETGLKSWTLEDFQRALRTGVRPDGRRLDDLMPWRRLNGMTDVEIAGLWAYLQSIPPAPFGSR